MLPPRFAPAVLRLCLALAGCLPFAAAAEGTLTGGVGMDFSSGKYGRSDHTETLNLPLIVKYESDPWVLRLTVPYLMTRGRANVSGSGSDRFDLGTTSSQTRTVEGLGDVVLGGTWTVFESNAWIVDVGAKIKFATADEQKGLGSGKNDYSLQTEAYRMLGQGHSVFGTLGGRKMGDPEGLDLRDPLYGSLGWSYRHSPTTSLGISYDYRQKLLATSHPISEATFFLTNKLGDGLKLQTYLVRGFSDGSPELGGGVMLSISR